MRRMSQASRIGILMVLLVMLSARAVPSGHLASAQATIQETVIGLSGDRIFYASLATADFNGDGYKEIVAGGKDGMWYVVSTSDGVTWGTVWSHQGNTDIEAANPPTSKSTNEIRASPAIADLDDDGHLDIVIAMGGSRFPERSTGWHSRPEPGCVVYGTRARRLTSPRDCRSSVAYDNPSSSRSATRRYTALAKASRAASKVTVFQRYA